MECSYTTATTDRPHSAGGGFDVRRSLRTERSTRRRRADQRCHRVDKGQSSGTSRFRKGRCGGRFRHRSIPSVRETDVDSRAGLWHSPVSRNVGRPMTARERPHLTCHPVVHSLEGKRAWNRRAAYSERALDADMTRVLRRVSGHGGRLPQDVVDVRLTKATTRGPRAGRRGALSRVGPLTRCTMADSRRTPAGSPTSSCFSDLPSYGGFSEQ